MATLAELLVKVRGDTSQVEKDLTKLENKWKKLGSQLESVGSRLTAGLTVPIVGLAATSLKMAGDFEAGMNRVAAVSGATGAEFDALQAQAKELGRTTQFSASQAADAMGFLAMAGFKANEIIEAMPGTLQLAASAGMDLGSAADIVSNILTGYGLKVDELGRANDVLVKTMTSANVDLRMLGESMKYVGPVASGMGLSFESVAAAVGLMGNAGIQGSMAGTALRGAISRLANPTKQVSELLDGLGVKVFDAAGSMYPLVEIVRQLEESGASTADMMAIFGDRAGPAMAALVDQGSVALAGLTEELLNSGGTAADIAAVQMQGFKGGVKALQSAFEGLMIALASSGLLEWVTELTQRLTGWLQRLSETNPEMLRLITVIGLAVAALGPMIWIVGKAITTVSGLIGAAKLLVGALGFLLSPVGLVVAAIAVLVAIFLYLWTTNEEFRAAMLAIWEQIMVVGLAIWEMLSAALADIWAGIQLTAEAVFGALQEFWDNWGATILAVATGIWNQIRLVIETAINLVKDIIGLVLAVIRGDWTEVWERIKSIGATIWNYITGTLENMADTMGRIWDSVRDKVDGVWKGIVNSIIGYVNRVIDAVNWMIRQLNKLSFSFPDWVPGLGGKGFSLSIGELSHIPALASGGIATAPTLAMIGDGADEEAVIPLNARKLAAAGLGGGGSVTINWSSLARPSDAEVRLVAQMIDRELGK